MLLWPIFIYYMMHILTSVKSLSRNYQHQDQQQKYPEMFHLICFQSALGCFEITVWDYCWVSLCDVLCVLVYSPKLVYNECNALLPGNQLSWNYCKIFRWFRTHTYICTTLRHILFTSYLQQWFWPREEHLKINQYLSACHILFAFVPLLIRIIITKTHHRRKKFFF